MQRPIQCPTEGCLVTSVLMSYRHFSKTYPRKVHRTPPHTFDDMQVSAAQARRTDTHNDLIGGRDGGFRHHLQREIHMHVLVIGVQSRGFHRTCSSLSIVPTTLLDMLAGGSTSQHNVPGQLHVPVVLGELFVTLNQEMPLCPFLMLRPHRGGKRRGLIALDMGNVGLDFLFSVAERSFSLLDRVKVG